MRTLPIEPASPWQNGHVESFYGSLRDECLDREIMLSVAEACGVIEDHRHHYNKGQPLLPYAHAGVHMRPRFMT